MAAAAAMAIAISLYMFAIVVGVGKNALVLVNGCDVLIGESGCCDEKRIDLGRKSDSYIYMFWHVTYLFDSSEEHIHQACSLTSLKMLFRDS